jgi:hypothetical protein
MPNTDRRIEIKRNILKSWSDKLVTLSATAGGDSGHARKLDKLRNAGRG